MLWRYLWKKHLLVFLVWLLSLRSILFHLVLYVLPGTILIARSVQFGVWSLNENREKFWLPLYCSFVSCLQRYNVVQLCWSFHTSCSITDIPSWLLFWSFFFLFMSLMARICQSDFIETFFQTKIISVPGLYSKLQSYSTCNCTVFFIPGLPFAKSWAFSLEVILHFVLRKHMKIWRKLSAKLCAKYFQVWTLQEILCSKKSFFWKLMWIVDLRRF